MPTTESRTTESPSTESPTTAQPDTQEVKQVGGPNDPRLDGERAELLEALRTQRSFLKYTVSGLTDEQAGATPTASRLCLGGLIKHVATTEESWARFIAEGPAAQAMTDDSYAEHEQSFRMLPGETVESIVAGYDEVAAQTEELVASLPDLDVSHRLPEAPWFEPGKSWSARRVLAHILAETAQHAGHADIIRETIDGQKTMG